MKLYMELTDPISMTRLNHSVLNSCIPNGKCSVTIYWAKLSIGGTSAIASCEILK